MLAPQFQIAPPRSDARIAPQRTRHASRPTPQTLYWAFVHFPGKRIAIGRGDPVVRR